MSLGEGIHGSAPRLYPFVGPGHRGFDEPIVRDLRTRGVEDIVEALPLLSPYGDPSRRWIEELVVRDVPAGGVRVIEEAFPPMPFGSKLLYRFSVKLPHSNRLQVNFSRLILKLDNQMLDPYRVPRYNVWRRKPVYLALSQPALDRSPEILRGREEAPGVHAGLPAGTAGHRGEPRVGTQLAEPSGDPSPTLGVPTRPAGVVLETFEGYVERVDDDTAYVRLKSRDHGDVLYGRYSATDLASRGIGEQCRFLCRTIKVDGAIRLDLEAVPDPEVSEEELRAIEEEIDRVLPRDDDGIEY